MVGEALRGGQFGASSRSATSIRNAPPDSTADSCAQSPTSSTLAPTALAWAVSRSRARVPAIEASSTITSWPGCSSQRWTARRKVFAAAAEAGGTRRAVRERRRARLIGEPAKLLPPTEVAVGLVEPFGGVLGGHAQRAGQHPRRLCRRRQPEHASGSVFGFPGPSKGRQGGGFAGPGRPDQHVQAAPGGCHRQHGSGLILAEAAVTRDGRGDHPPDQVRIDTRPGERAAGVEQPRLGLEHCSGGVDGAELGTELARPVGTAEHRWRARRGWGGQQHRPCLHSRHQPAVQRVPVGAGGQPVFHARPSRFGVDVPVRPGGPRLVQPGQNLGDQLGFSGRRRARRRRASPVRQCAR